MPSRDENGKRIPGCRQRARKAAREAPDPPAKKRRAKKPDAPTTSEPASAPHAEAEGWFSGPNPFERAGDAPIDDTAKTISWGARLHALGVEDIARHPNMFPNRREWIRAVIDGTTKLGVIRDKAMEQSRIDAALRRDEQASKKQGLTSAHGRKAPPIARPPG